MKNIILYTGLLGLCLWSVWYFCPRYFIACESDSRPDEHPEMFGVRLRDVIKTKLDIPDSFVVTNVERICFLSPEILYRGIPKRKTMPDMNNCVIGVSEFDHNITRIQCSKEYGSYVIADVDADFKVLCDYVECHYKGSPKFIDHKTHWSKEWDIGYGQKITVSYSGPRRRAGQVLIGGSLCVSLADCGRERVEHVAAKHRRLSEL